MLSFELLETGSVQSLSSSMSGECLHSRVSIAAVLFYRLCFIFFICKLLVTLCSAGKL